MPPIAIKAEGLGKQYRVGQLDSGYDTLREHLVRVGRSLVGRGPASVPTREFWALEDISFEVEEGEILGIIGHNGAGKTTLLRLLARITQPTKGYADVHGRLGSLLEVGTGFHPELTGRENIFLNGSILGMTKNEVRRKFDEIVAFADVEAFIDTPVKRYSSGMAVRLAFSVAAHLEPEILLIDEALSVGDAEFQRKCLGKMQSVGQSGRTVLFVSHNMPAVTRLCERVIVLDHGRIAMDAPAETAVAAYLQTVHGSSSERTWGEDDAPGTDKVRLRAIRVVDSSGRGADAHDARFRIGIEYVVDVLQPVQFVPWLEIYDGQERLVFAAFDTDPVWETAREPGRYTCTAWIPPNLFNEGTFSVSPSLRTFVAGTKAIRHAQVPVAIAFQVVDRGEGDSARGNYAGLWPGGSVRPLLDWTTARSLETGRKDEMLRAGSGDP